MAVQLIEVDVDTQARVGISDETIAEYVLAVQDAQERGDPWPFPPVDVFFDGAQYFVGDGWHRILATLQTTIACIPAIVHNGGQREALLFATGANSRHGLTRTDHDKWRAVELLLQDEEWRQWSDHLIAEHCHVSHPFVGKVRRKFEEDATGNAFPVDRLGKDGKRRKTKAKPAEAPVASSNGEAHEDEEQAAEETAEPAGLDVEALAKPYRKALTDLRAVKKSLVAMAAEAEVGVHLARVIARVKESIDDACGAVRSSEPVALCGKCGGEKCQHCGRTGFWTRFIVETHKRS